MAENCSRKLIIEVCNAKNLMPKDGQGTASAYVIVDYDGQRRRTKTIFRDLNPQWDEKLEFMVHDVGSMATEILELNVYNDKKAGRRSTFLGKVKISGSSFGRSGEDVPLVYYPLEKRSVFSQIKGEIGLKVSYVDEEPPPAPAPEKNDAAAPVAAEKPAEKEEENKQPPPEGTEEKKEEEKKTASDEAKKEEKPPETAPAPQPPPPSTPPPASTEVEHPPIAQQKSTQNSEKMATLENSKNLEIESKLFQKISGGNADRRIAFDLVDKMPFLYVRVVKAKISKPEADSSFSAKLVIGTHSIKTKSQAANKEWDQVFAFDKEGLNSTSLEVSVWTQNKNAGDGAVNDVSAGTVSFDLQEVPKRVPPDSPLAPQWYSLEGGEGSPGNDVMLSVWIGTQADEAFQEAWQSDSGGLIPETRAKVYLSPKLWYLRLTVIQTQDLQLGSDSEPKARNPELYVKAQLGAQLFKTSRTIIGSSSNPTWNEDLLFVAAEPFEPFLIVTVEDVTNGHAVGHAKVQLSTVDRRTDDKSEPRSRWFNLIGGDENSKPYAGRIHVRVCLEGGYHVLDEAAHVTSDVRPTAKQLSKPPIGLLDVGIRGAANLLPVKTKDGTRGTTDAYVVAKYGPKWVRTRSILDRFNPRWNEQYTWDVYDPCTVLTIGVFDNGRYKNDDAGSKRDVRLGKLRVRLSTLDTNRVYVGTYNLIVLLPGGAKKMGEIEIAVRFSCSSWISLVHAYANPTLPRMHYVKPLGPAQQDVLRHNAMKIVAARLARSEPPLGQEVVQFMLDSDIHMWSMRRSKANWFRVVGCLSRAAALARWLDGIRTWVHPPTSILVHVLLVAVALCPHLVLPTIFMYAFLIVVLRFRYRQRASITMDPRLSHVDAVGADELDEEFDGFPTSRSVDQIRVRYDRLRALAGRAQTLLGDVAAQGERLEALFNWKDPRATGIFVVVCLLASLIFYVVSFKAFLLASGFYYLRHPRFRDDMPSPAMNFFRRLPPQSDRIL
ncbi:FT-interacting protein 7 [Andrographis paniculata]|uniref:FT-interacting protein 7 n=1 Tax=Andrographis paniculata TaxID=175694 RepID=UPI0021E8DAB0|nr:FT-interacting protein 7 [Andrographis paniculata]